MGRRGFLITTGIGIGVLSRCAQKGMGAHAEKAPAINEKCADEVKAHRMRITGLSFSPDGKLPASGSYDKTIKLWEMPSGNFLTCLFDPGVLERGRKAIQYVFKNEYGQMITYTLPCGSPIPPGATCTCNCVPGTYSPPKPRRGTGQQYCSCVPVCTCVPIK